MGAGTPRGQGCGPRVRFAAASLKTKIFARRTHCSFRLRVVRAEDSNPSGRRRNGESCLAESVLRPPAQGWRQRRLACRATVERNGRKAQSLTEVRFRIVFSLDRRQALEERRALGRKKKAARRSCDDGKARATILASRPRSGFDQKRTEEGRGRKTADRDDLLLKRRLSARSGRARFSVRSEKSAH